MWADCTAAPEWGAADEGDLLGTNPVVFELKDEARYDFAGWLREAVTEAANASKRRNKALIPAVIHHPKGKGKPEDAGVYMRLQDLIALLRLLGAKP
jgi:hypothetical protein